MNKEKAYFLPDTYPWSPLGSRLVGTAAQQKNKKKRKEGRKQSLR